MKKIVFVFLVSLALTHSIKAQDVYFGPKVGVNISHFMFTGDDAVDFKDMSKMKMSSHFGIFAEIVVNDFFSVQPELLYSIKGARFRDSTDDDFKSAYVFKYLSLPVVVKYYVTKEISLEAGPQVAYLLSAKNIETSDRLVTNVGHEAASEDINDKIQDFDLGVTAGLGYLTKKGFYFSARYNYGILNAQTKEENVDAILHNGTVQLSFGFSFQ
jgi:hypothetical protein